jgi:hypothetical protein
MECVSLSKRREKDHKEYNSEIKQILTIKTSIIGFEPMKQYNV